MPDHGVDGRVALIGGSSKGLGFAAAEELAGAGCDVALSGRSESSLKAAAEQVRAGTNVARRIVHVPTDLTEADSVTALVQEVADELGPINILVNNTGGPPPGGFEDMSDDDWYKAIELTFMSTVRLYRAVLPHMKTQNWGRIINIASLSVLQPIDDLILSNALRMGVQGLAKSIAMEVAPYGITVNSVCPTFTRTDRVQGLIESQAARGQATQDEITGQLTGSIPAGRLGEPAEVAGAVAYLASESARFITGAVIPVAGGANKPSV